MPATLSPGQDLKAAVDLSSTDHLAKAPNGRPGGDWEEVCTPHSRSMTHLVGR